MRTHADIIEAAGGNAAMARAVNADANLVNQWKRQRSIPAAWWKAVSTANLATLEELAAAAEARRTEAA